MTPAAAPGLGAASTARQQTRKAYGMPQLGSCPGPAGPWLLQPAEVPDPGPDQGRLRVSGMGVVVAVGPVGRRRFGLGGGRSCCSLQSSEPHLRFCVGPPATVSGLTLPAGQAGAGRSPSYPSRIRVERAATRGAASQGARCPAAAGAAPGQVCAAGPGRRIRASPKRVGEIKMHVARRSNMHVPRNWISSDSVGVQVMLVVLPH